MLPSVLGDAVKHPYNTFRMLGAAFSVTLGTRLGLGPPDGLHSSAVTPETLARGAAYRVDESWTVLVALALGSREPVQPVGAPTLVVAGHQDRFTPTRVLQPLAAALEADLLEFDVAHAFNEEPTHTCHRRRPALPRRHRSLTLNEADFKEPRRLAASVAHHYRLGRPMKVKGPGQNISGGRIGRGLVGQGVERLL